MSMLAAVLLFLAISAESAEKQACAAKPFPSNYGACHSLSTLENLVDAGANCWSGLPDEDRSNFRALEGYYVCRSVIEPGDSNCGRLQGLFKTKSGKPSETESRYCLSDRSSLSFHDAMARSQDEEAVTHCSHWCRANRGERGKNLLCPNLCRRIVQGIRSGEGRRSCESAFSEASKKLGLESHETGEAVQYCRLHFSPAAADCSSAPFGTEVDCRARIAAIGAISARDPKRCPRDQRFSSACRALLAKEQVEGSGDPDKICAEPGLLFMKGQCDHYKQSGGLQEGERPGGGKSRP